MAISWTETGLRPTPAKLLAEYTEWVSSLTRDAEGAAEQAAALVALMPSSALIFGDDGHDHVDRLGPLLAKAAERFAPHETEYWELRRLAAELGTAIIDMQAAAGTNTTYLERAERALANALRPRSQIYTQGVAKLRARRKRAGKDING